MKQVLLLLICVSLHLPVSAQDKAIDSLGDKSFNYPFSQADMVKYNLADLKTTQQKCFYRFWTGKQIIDIWSDDNLTYQGCVLNFIYKRSAKKGGYTLIAKSEKVSTNKARQIVNLFQDNKLMQIPTEMRIKGWQRGLDGWVYVSQYATPISYSQRRYWSPDGQTCLEGLEINNFINQLKKVLRLNDRYQSFQSQLDFGNYFVGMTNIHIYPTPRKAKGGSSLFN